jgi:hypothetical protein
LQLSIQARGIVINITHVSPSEKYQRWDLIVGFTLLLGIITSLILIYLSWSWFSTWPSFFEQSEILIAITKESLSGTVKTWYIYLEYLKINNWVDDFIFHLFLPSLFAFYLVSLLMVKALYIDGGRTLERHLHGVTKLKHQAAQKHAKRQLKSECKHGAIHGLFLHPLVQISLQSEVGNIFISGKPGSGKTVIIFYLLQQLLMREVRAFIYDAKGEVTEKFYHFDNTILISPWDKRGVAWNISFDLSSPNAPLNFAKHVIPKTSDAIWSQASRLILVGMINVLQQQKEPWGWIELYKLLTSEDAILRGLLSEHYPQAIRFVEENNRTTQSIMMTLQSDLDWFQCLAKAWPLSYQSEFSIHQWVHDTNAKPNLIVQGNKQFSAVGGPLCHAMMSLMGDEYLSMENTFPCYLVLDELANFQKSEALIQWLELARERGGRTIAGTQAISQLTSLYGEHDKNSMLSMFTNLITLKAGAIGETANFMSKALGEHIIGVPQYQSTNGVNKLITYQEKRVPTIYPFDITELSNPDNSGVKGFLSVNGWKATYELSWPYLNLPTIAQKSILADWATNTKSRKNTRGKPTKNQRVRISKRSQNR